jgi:hypothetical protein
MGQLTVEFSGVCTHFHHNYVPGIPHRVVLPDARSAIPGFLTGPFVGGSIDDPSAWLPYFLMPHVPIIALDPPPADPLFTFATPGLIDEKGHFITPCRLEVVNASGTGISYPDGSFMTVPQLTTYFAAYVPSDDVIRNGRASAYFDISSGEIRATVNVSEIGVTATIDTDGPPRLRISAFSAVGLPIPEIVKDLPEVSGKTTLLFGNNGLVCEDGRSQYDFLLHYLTSQQRIPRALTTTPPGLMTTDKCPKSIEASLELLKESGYPVTFDFGMDFDTSAACSDSRYP